MFGPIGRYITEARTELRKVTWPTRQKTIQQSILVLGISVVAAVFLGSLDWVLNFSLEYLLK